MDLDKLEPTINNCLRKTINRFRERPLYYFTESDIHSSLQGDLLNGNSQYFYFDNKISLVHLEYPTNFRYEKQRLLAGYQSDVNVQEHQTFFTNNHGDRGNFDLAVLERNFIDNSITLNTHDEGVRRIINKDIDLLKKRFEDKYYGLERIQKEILYSIEVKFIHPFNARNINMLEEIIKDNEKLNLALYHSQEFIRPINLIFCSSETKERRDKQQTIIDRVRKYIETGNIELSNGISKQIPEGVMNIFIESYFDENAHKLTPKPILYCRNPKDWAIKLMNVFK
jgi:hypothetical protein